MIEPGAREAVELRLALVCYGGVSLAVYMHGVTKELHKLVRASRALEALDDLDAPNPFKEPDPALAADGVDSERAYFEALRDLARQGHRVSVVIDIITGTSAGGINGVCLAKVVEDNGSLARLRNLWVDEGDIKRLLRAPDVHNWKLQTAIAGLGILAAPLSKTSLLRGDRMSQLLFDCLRDMAKSVDPHQQTLLRFGGSLDLFITTTDLQGFEVLVPTGTGGASQRDRYHAQVLQFRSDCLDGRTSSGLDPSELTLAARATSSFPGAFPAVSLTSFKEELNSGTAVGVVDRLRGLFSRKDRSAPERPFDPDAVAAHFRFAYEESGGKATDAWLVDGGVLDNAPFDLAIEAIANKRAESEVIRRLIYIQPDPSRSPLLQSERREPRQYRSRWLQDVLTAVVAVKGTHPILQELLRLQRLNLRIAQVGAIAEAQSDQVVAAVDDLFARRIVPSQERAWSIRTKDDVSALGEEMHALVRDRLGAGFATYNRLKVEAAGRRLAKEVADRFVYPPDSSRTSFLRAALGAWARLQDPWRDPDPTRLTELLGPVDVPYRERRLLFLLAGINPFYREQVAGDESPPRTDLDALKREAWNLLESLRSIPAAAVNDVPDHLVEFLRDADAYADPHRFAVDHQDDFLALFQQYRGALEHWLGDSSIPLWMAFESITESWSEEHRKALLSRYLGFPYWDALIYPTIALSELPQFTPIGVSQFSPYTAQAIPIPPEKKLRGVTLHHFGGFLSAEWRENDYLWGRLDGAELVLRTLKDAGATATATADSEPTMVPQTSAEAAWHAGPHLTPALQAILDSEQQLSRITNLRDELQHHVDRLAAQTDVP